MFTDSTVFKFEIHSPIEPLRLPEFEAKGVRVAIKRDDLIHPFISGNKWRKLKHILAAAASGGKTHLVSFGGTWSNHLLALACAGARFGFQTSAFVRGEQVVNPNLSLCRIFGMHLYFVDRLAYRNKPALFQEYFGSDKNAYFVDEGGYGLPGAQGCSELWDELDMEYDHVFCACGTGTTLAGLQQGKASRGLRSCLHGVPVLSGGDFIADAVATLCSGDTAGIELHTEYHFGGYAKSTPELDAFIRRFCADTGILIEPVYTGKVLFALMDLIAREYFRQGETILILHTGGLTGVLGAHERLAGAAT